MLPSLVDFIIVVVYTYKEEVKRLKLEHNLTIIFHPLFTKKFITADDI